MISNEKSICQKLHHPFIVGLKHCFESRKFVCFVFECIFSAIQTAPADNCFTT